MEIIDRQTLSNLWTLWCVDRTAPDRMINIGRDPAHNARQLRVREVDRPAVWSALAQQETRHGIPSACNIKRIGSWLSEPYTVVVEAFQLPDSGEWVICEGNHTSCALYLLAPDRFKLRVECKAAWPAYLDPRLRS